MKTNDPAQIKKAPEEDVANQFTEFLKIINIDEIKSRKLDVVKLTSRVSLQKMITGLSTRPFLSFNSLKDTFCPFFSKGHHFGQNVLF